MWCSSLWLRSRDGWEVLKMEEGKPEVVLGFGQWFLRVSVMLIEIAAVNLKSQQTDLQS